jgi:hypothetical protein
MSNKMMIGRNKGASSIEPLVVCTYLGHNDSNAMLSIDVEVENASEFETFCENWKKDTFSDYNSRVYNNNMEKARLTVCLPGFKTDRDQVLSPVIFDGYQKNGNEFNIRGKYLPPKF